MGVNLKFRSSQLNPDKSYELSAIVGKNCFFYALLDYGQQLVMSNFVEVYSYGMESAHVIIGEILEQEGIEITKLRKVKIAILNAECTVVPRASFDPRLKRTYLQYMVDLDESVSSIYTDFSPHLVFVYQADTNLVESIKYLFDDPMIYHIDKPLVDAELLDTRSGVYAHFIDDEMQIQHIEDQQLKIVANYHLPSPLAGLYYLSLCFQKYNLDHQNTLLYISGQVDDSTEISELLRRYFGSIVKAECPIHFENYYDFPSHCFYPLHCVSQCV